MEQSDRRSVIDRWKDHLRSVSGEELDAELASIPRDVLSELMRDPELGQRLSSAVSRMKARESQSASGNAASGKPAAKPGSASERVGTVEITEEDERDAESLREHATSAARARRDKEEKEQRDEQEKKLSLLAQISKMDVGAKAKLAREGAQDARTILIKEGNKVVSMAVLANPRITIQEIEIICASRNISEDILREISKNRDWMKSYSVKLALANNPKTPVGIGLTLIAHLQKRDLKFLSKSKGVPEPIRVAARKLFIKKSSI